MQGHLGNDRRCQSRDLGGGGARFVSSLRISHRMVQSHMRHVLLKLGVREGWI